jgi:hypothetical protein
MLRVQLCASLSPSPSLPLLPYCGLALESHSTFDRPAGFAASGAASLEAIPSPTSSDQPALFWEHTETYAD